MTILWWHWLLLGLVFLLAELLAAGSFYMVFFGVSALVVGALAAAGVVQSTSIALLVFSTVSGWSLLLFRQRLLRSFQREPQRPQVDALIGEIGTTVDDLGPSEMGRVELRGTPWSARNATDVLVPRGTRCRVVRVEGLTVHVAPEGVR